MNLQKNIYSPNSFLKWYIFGIANFATFFPSVRKRRFRFCIVNCGYRCNLTITEVNHVLILFVFIMHITQFFAEASTRKTDFIRWPGVSQPIRQLRDDDRGQCGKWTHPSYTSPFLEVSGENCTALCRPQSKVRLFQRKSSRLVTIFKLFKWVR